MRKVIYAVMVSIDGFIEGPNQELDWHLIDEELHRHFNELENTIDIHLYGRRLYENMAAYWPSADENPSAPEYVVEYARIWRNQPKIVFSKTLQHVDNNARLVREVNPREIKQLREQPGKDMSLGGAELAATFMKLGLIDEYQMYVNPVIVGGGTPMFPALNVPLSLQLLETRTFSSGVVLLRYQSSFKEGGERM